MNFPKGILGIISPCKCINLCTGILTYYIWINLCVNLFFLDYFVTFSVRFGLSVHLELTSKTGDQKQLTKLCCIIF